MVVLVLVGVASVLVMRRLGAREALRQAERIAVVAGRGVVEPRLTDGILHGDSSSLLLIDELVSGGVIRGPIHFKVVQGVVGDMWGAGITHNRHVLFRALLATHGDDGSFAVRVWNEEHRRPRFFRARARNLATDEICRGRAVI